jgi:putative ATP-binding cassette transporter
MVVNASVTIVAFSGVLWSISPLLFGAAVVYAGGGSLLTVVLGRQLAWLNFNQSDKEAYLRASLIHLRENAEAVALLQREGRLKARALRNVDELTRNMKRIIAVNRNLSFFTTGYNYVIQILPALIVAPLFIRGQAEFGVISQSAMAFSHLVGAFSLIVNQFGQISSYAAVVARLGSFAEAVDALRNGEPPALAVVEDADRIAYEDVTLLGDGGEPLVSALSAVVTQGTNVLVSGSNEAAKTALVRATARVAVAGSGTLRRPPAGELLVIPERAYLPPGTLREGILRTGREVVVEDEHIGAVLALLAIEALPGKVGGLDAERNWDEVLSPDQRQMLAVARVLLAKPRFVILDRIHKSLAARQCDLVYRALDADGITYVTIADGEARATGSYGAELMLEDGGGWHWNPRAPQSGSATNVSERAAAKVGER